MMARISSYQEVLGTAMSVFMDNAITAVDNFSSAAELTPENITSFLSTLRTSLINV